MRRSVGVTISAVIVFVGCGLVLLQALATAFGAAMLAQMRQEPSFLGPILIIEIIFLVGLAGWGVATGVGLIRLSNWARVSMIVFSLLLVFMTLVPAILFIFVPLPVPPDAKDPELAASVMTMMRAVMVGVGLTLAALGGWWIYFFTKKSTREQFAGMFSATAAPAAAHGIQFDVPPPMRRLGRPVSITVIAVLLLIPACFTPFSLLEMRFLFPNREFPFMFFGLFLTGSAGIALFLVLMVCQAIAGVGLLKLKPWARILAIWLQAFSLLNMVVSFGLPGSRARFSEWMNSLMTSDLDRLRVPQQIDMKPMFEMISKSAIWGVVVSVPVLFVIIWFLVREKEAFYRPKEGAAQIS